MPSMSDQILDALTDRVQSYRQQFEVFWAIVLAVSVLVVNVLVFCERASQDIAHHEPVFFDEPGGIRHHMPGEVEPDISMPVDAFAPSPSRSVNASLALDVMATNEAMWVAEVLKMRRSALLSNRRGLSAAAAAEACQQREDITWRDETFLATASYVPGKELRKTVSVMRFRDNRFSTSTLAQRNALFAIHMEMVALSGMRG